MSIFGGDPEAKERERWERLDGTVVNGLRNFQILGAALKEIRDTQLYRFAHMATFEECCDLRWKITARHARNLIAAYETARVLGTEVPPDVSERQLRPLASLPLAERRAAFDEAKENGGTTAAIERAVAKRKPAKKKSAALKPLRLKVPGGTVIIQPNRKGKDYDEILRFAVEMMKHRAAA